MNLSHAVAAIQSMVGSVKGVQILYSEKVQNSNMFNFIYIQAGCTLRCMGFFLWQTHKPNLPNLPGQGRFF